MQNLFFKREQWGKRKHKLRYKISAGLAWFAFLPAFILGAFIIDANSKTQQENGISTAVQQFSLSHSSIQTLIQSVQSTANVLSQDQTLQQAHSTFARPNTTLSEAIDMYILLDRLLSYLNVTSHFSGIRLYLPDYDTITSQEWTLYGLSALEEELLPPEVLNGTSAGAWSLLHPLVGDRTESVVSYYHTLTSYRKYTTQTSMICVNLAESLFLNCYPESGGKEQIFFILDQNGELLLPTEGVTDEIRRMLPPDQVFSGKIKQEGLGQCYYQSAEILENGWRLCMLVPLAQFQENSALLLFYYVGILLLICLLILFCSQLVAHRLASELTELTEKCEKLKSGIYETSSSDSSTMEIALLQSTFNAVVDQIDRLINDVYEERLAKQETRVSLLYEQMKPHFLYNTLESAKWIAVKGCSMEVAKFMEDLSRYFRLTLGKGEDWMTLQQEINLAETYVTIMNARFHNSILLQKDIPFGLMEEPLLRLLIQPFLENAVLHGLYEKKERAGMILLSVELTHRSQWIRITIADDGVGMDEASFDRLNQGEKLGFGISNVQERLKLYYGDACSIIFHQNEWQGTTVELVIPRRLPSETKEPLS